MTRTPNLNASILGFYKTGCRSGYAGMGGVVLKGDVLYVKDACRDGHSAFVEWREKSHPTIRRICRDGRGAGTIVRCDFDWPETTGILIVGFSDGTRILHTDDGNSVWLTQNGTEVTPPDPVW